MNVKGKINLKGKLKKENSCLEFLNSVKAELWYYTIISILKR